jgi:hypothetical protein
MILRNLGPLSNFDETSLEVVQQQINKSNDGFVRKYYLLKINKRLFELWV